MRWTLVLGVWGVVALGALVAWFAYDLPDVEDVAAMTRRPSVMVLAADGSTLATFGQLYGDVVPVRDLPPYLPGAVLAIEDRRFYQHWGVDVFGVARAAVVNTVRGRVVQGGSTITQQTAKNLFLSHERTYKRKVQEVLLALWLETRFSKDEILTLYLNRVYMGAGTYGVEAAAQRYFSRSAREVTVHQAAILAGLLRAPSVLNPFSNPQRSEARAATVLAAMVETGLLTQAQAEAARTDRSATVAGVRRSGLGRHFADWVMEAVATYATVDRDVVVRTTLDPVLQDMAENALARALREDGARVGAGDGAIVLMTPDGAVRAMVGGRDYARSQFNRAVQARRQPGSAFKPVVFLAAVEAGVRPDDRVLDAPIRIGNWAPTNFDNTFRGEVTVREALAHSLNTPTVRLQEQVGRNRVVATARRLGLSGASATASLGLGTQEMALLPLTAAYASFANGGDLAFPHGITEIRGRDGSVLYRRGGSGGGQAVNPVHVATMNDMLAATLAWGTGKAAALDRPAAGKTGTSQNNRDGWFIGYTAHLVGGVWLGNDDDRPMRGPDGAVTGGGLPARIWRDVMDQAHQGIPPRALPTRSVQAAPRPASDAPPPRSNGGPSPEDGLSRLFRDVFGLGEGVGEGEALGR